MKMNWQRVEVRAAEPFRISRSVQTTVSLVWVKIESNGIEGWGEADPNRYYGETPDTVEAALEKMRPVIEAADDATAIETLETDLHHAIGKNGSAHAAVSAALHDMLGKRVGEPLWRLWGLTPADAPLSSFTIGLADPDEMGEKTAQASQYPILKIKLGTDPRGGARRGSERRDPGGCERRVESAPGHSTHRDARRFRRRVRRAAASGVRS